MKYHIACNTDSNYLQHCIVMLCSLFENNKKEFIVHILSNGLTENDIKEFDKLCKKYGQEYEIHIVDEEGLDGLMYRKNRPLSKAAYYRCKLQNILPDVDKVLYLDCDLVITGSVLPLFEIDLEDYPLAAVADTCPYNDLHRRQLGLSLDQQTFCSGVMVINLEYWRKVNAQEKLLAFSRKYREPVYLHDQDALNYVFKNKWFVLPPKWNHSAYYFKPWPSLGTRPFDLKETFFNTVVWHYCGPVKPWQDCKSPERKHYLKYLELSGYSGKRFNKTTFTQKLKGLKVCIDYFYWKHIDVFVPKLVKYTVHDLFILPRLLLLALKPSRYKDTFMHYYLDENY